MTMPFTALPPSAGYAALAEKLRIGVPVLTDGGVATELERWRPRSRGRDPWGTWALYSAQTAVSDVHRGYVAAGCDVISTNSWAILEAARDWDGPEPSPAWESAVDGALRLARQAVELEGREDECAVAFCINGDLSGTRALGALELMTWRWREGSAPDLVVFETLKELPGAPALEAVGMVRELGLPVWVGMRRGAGGMASVDGSVTPDAGPSGLPRAAAALVDAGVSALLVNCVPVDLAATAVEELVRATDLPIGCMPNHGAPLGATWCGGRDLDPEQFAIEILDWLERGAQIVGGCCGITVDHIAAGRRMLDSAAAWSARGV